MKREFQNEKPKLEEFEMKRKLNSFSFGNTDRRFAMK